MKLVRCDMCGCDIEETAGAYEFSLSGDYPIDYKDRDGYSRSSDDFEYDLCTDCARDIVTEIIERNKKEVRHV